MKKNIILLVVLFMLSMLFLLIFNYKQPHSDSAEKSKPIEEEVLGDEKEDTDSNKLNIEAIKRYNTPFNLDEKLEEIKKIPWEEKRDFIVNTFGFFPSDNRIDYGILVLYMMPKDALNDIFSLKIYIDYPNKDNFGYFIDRLRRPNYNIFFESNLLWSASPSDIENAEIYKFYDNFNKILTEGNFNIDNKFDKKLLNKLAGSIFITNRCDYPNYEFKSEDSDFMNLFGKYISILSSPKNQKINNSYNIYRLGSAIISSYNENSYSFILKKLNNKNTNLENFCYFLYNINFDIPMPSNIEKEFDEGIYNPQRSILGHKQQLSEITGKKNDLIKYAWTKDIVFNPEERILLSQVSLPDNTNAFKIIDTIASDSSLSMKERAGYLVYFIFLYEYYQRGFLAESISHTYFEYMNDRSEYKVIDNDGTLEEMIISQEKSWDEIFDYFLKALHKQLRS